MASADVCPSFSSFSISSIFSPIEQEKLQSFHQQVINLLQKDPWILSDTLLNYNDFLHQCGNCFLDQANLEVWKQIYQVRQFVYFLKSLSHQEIDKASDQRLQSILMVIETFFTDFTYFTGLKKADEFNKVYHYPLEKVLKCIHQRVIGEFATDDVYQAYKKLHHTLIHHHIDFDFYVSRQEIGVEINPIDEALAAKPMKFSNYQLTGQSFQGAYFNNQQVNSLNLNVNHYGFKGDLTLELVIDSENFHKEYLPIFHGLPLSIAIIVRQTYLFKTLEDPEQSFSETLVYHGVSINQNNTIDIKERQGRNNSVMVHFNFCDPLKAFLSQSHPMRLARNMSYSDLISKLLAPYKNWIELDNKGSKAESLLKKAKHPQIFIFCDRQDKRSLYDFLIETLSHHGVNLQCQYMKKYEDLEQDKNFLKKALYELKIAAKTQYKLYPNGNNADDRNIEKDKRIHALPEMSLTYNRWHLDTIQVNPSQTIISTLQVINANGYQPKLVEAEKEDKEGKKEKDQNTSDSSSSPILPKSQMIKSFYHDAVIIEPDEGRHQQYGTLWQKKSQSLSQYRTSCVLKWHQWPLLETRYPSGAVSELEAKGEKNTKQKKRNTFKIFDYSTGQYSKSQCLASYQLSLKKTPFIKKWIHDELLSIGENQNEDLEKKPEAYLERTGYLINIPEITHTVEVQQHYQTDTDNPLPLPAFTPFIAKSIYTRVFSRQEVDPKRQNEYQWHKASDNSEHCFSQEVTSKAENEPDQLLTFTPYADEQPFIKLTVPTEMLLEANKSDKNAFIYLPADQGQSFANQYFPYSQGDIIAVKVFNQESVAFEQLISNRFLIDKKGSEVFMQHTGYGLSDEVTLRYQDDSKDQQLKLEQTHQENKGYKHFLLSEKEGLTLKFSNKVQKQGKT